MVKDINIDEKISPFINFSIKNRELYKIVFRNLTDRTPQPHTFNLQTVKF